MCRWMGSHFHDWIDYNGVAHFRIFGVRQFFIFTISKRTRMFVLQMKSKVFFIQSKKLPECRRLLFPLLHAERDLKNGLIHKNRKLWLSWDRENYVFAQKWLRRGL